MPPAGPTMSPKYSRWSADPDPGQGGRFHFSVAANQIDSMRRRVGPTHFLQIQEVQRCEFTSARKHVAELERAGRQAR
jgi:hypothetical protein